TEGGRKVADVRPSFPFDLEFVGADATFAVVRRRLDVGGDGPLRVIDLTTENDRRLGTNKPETLLAFAASKDGSLMVTASEDDRTIRFWTDRWTVAKPPVELDEAVDHLAFTPDGAELVFTTATRIGLLDLKSPDNPPLFRKWNAIADELTAFR